MKTENSAFIFHNSAGSLLVSQFWRYPSFTLISIQVVPLAVQFCTANTLISNDGIHFDNQKFFLTFVTNRFIIYLSPKREVIKMAKMGRPTNNPKTSSTNIRLDEECIKILAEKQKTDTVPRAEWIRRGIKMLDKWEKP